MAGGVGRGTCGSLRNESCCDSPPVTGGTFNRGNNASYVATVSNFRLDKYEVTVARFRSFVEAWVNGWRPTTGAGKHTHIDSGAGLREATGNGGREMGWDTSWPTTYASSLPPTSAGWTSALTNCDAGVGPLSSTWSATARTDYSDQRPQNCLDWYRAYAFCIYDGGFLPSEAETNYAVVGGVKQLLYPWGAAAPGTDSKYAVFGCYLNGTGTCTGVTNIGAVGETSLGAGYFGQMDLAGNLAEWMLDWYTSPLPSTCINCGTFGTGQYRAIGTSTFRALTTTSNLSPLTSGGDNMARDYWGVRCARSPL